MTTPPATTGPHPLGKVLPLVVAGLGLVVFVISLFGIGGLSFALYSLVIGLLALVPLLKPKAVSAWVLVAIGAAVLLAAIGSMISYGDLPGLTSYWVAFVFFLLQLAAAAVLALVEAGMIKQSPKQPANAGFGGGYGQPGGQGGYGQPSRGYGAEPGYGAPGVGGGSYGQQQPAASQGYSGDQGGYGTPAATPGYGQSSQGGQSGQGQSGQSGQSGYGQSSGGYGQPTQQQPTYGTPASGSQYGGQYGSPQQGGQPGAGQQPGGARPAAPGTPGQENPGGPPASQPWQAPNS